MFWSYGAPVTAWAPEYCCRRVTPCPDQQGQHCSSVGRWFIIVRWDEGGGGGGSNGHVPQDVRGVGAGRERTRRGQQGAALTAVCPGQGQAYPPQPVESGPVIYQYTSPLTPRPSSLRGD